MFGYRLSKSHSSWLLEWAANPVVRASNSTAASLPLLCLEVLRNYEEQRELIVYGPGGKSLHSVTILDRAITRDNWIPAPTRP